MTIAEARKLLATPKFGDADHIKAASMLQMIGEMGSKGPNTPLDVDGMDCEECNGVGECSHCGQSCPECDGGSVDVSGQEVEAMDEDAIDELYDAWIRQKKAA